MTVVSNTSPITNLLTIGRLDLLEKVHNTLVIPVSVQIELSVYHSEFEENRLPLAYPWIQVRSSSPISLAQVRPYDLGPGESEALALSLELQADLTLLDELKARKTADLLKVKHTGTLGVLIVAKRKGALDRVKPIIDELIATAGFWMSSALYANVMEIARE